LDLQESLSALYANKQTSVLINYLFFRVTRKNALPYNYAQGTLLETQRPGHCTVLVACDNSTSIKKKLDGMPAPLCF
jgi:hypothetical protein